jgi:hypothetical protein
MTGRTISVNHSLDMKGDPACAVSISLAPVAALLPAPWRPGI